MQQDSRPNATSRYRSRTSAAGHGMALWPGAQTDTRACATNNSSYRSPMMDARWKSPVGTRDVQLEAGASYARPAVCRNNVINPNNTNFIRRDQLIHQAQPGSDLPTQLALGY